MNERHETTNGTGIGFSLSLRVCVDNGDKKFWGRGLRFDRMACSVIHAAKWCNGGGRGWTSAALSVNAHFGKCLIACFVAQSQAAPRP